MSMMVFKNVDLLSILLLLTMAVITKAKQCPDGTLAINDVCVSSGLNHRQRSMTIPDKASQRVSTCPVGTQVVSEPGGNFRCVDCPAGSFNANPGSPICYPCPIDYESSAGAGRCTPRTGPTLCPPGKVMIDGKCTRCPRGMCSIGYGATGCFRPPRGENCPPPFIAP